MILKNKDIKNENKFYIDINLSFFDGDKTEQPTGKKLADTRKEGRVAQSREIGTAAVFIVGFLTLKIFAGYMYEKCSELLNYNFVLISDIENIYTPNYIHGLIVFVFTNILFICLPMFAIAMFLGIVVNLAQVKWKPTFRPLRPRLSGFNPVSGIKKIFSTRQIVEFLKALAKLGILVYIIYSYLKDEVNAIQTLMFMSLPQSILYIGNLCIDLGMRVGYFFIAIAIVDYIYQKRSFIKSIKMSKQEVKDEYKMAEGDPHTKAKIKRKMQEISMRRMMQEVPNADVIITNPTHYAVAIKYDREKAAAPVVLAKGSDHLARRIKEKAKEFNIEIVENKPLARALYNTVEVGREIPPELYQAVAEVLAFVYKLRNVV